MNKEEKEGKLDDDDINEMMFDWFEKEPIHKQ
jgi:hypothetical protein